MFHGAWNEFSTVFLTRQVLALHQLESFLKSFQRPTLLVQAKTPLAKAKVPKARANCPRRWRAHRSTQTTNQRLILDRSYLPASAIDRSHAPADRERNKIAQETPARFCETLESVDNQVTTVSAR
jgi:hypothetical protein